MRDMMSYVTKRESPFLQALHSCNHTGKIPLWFMRQAGRYQPSYQKLKERYSFSELCLTPELACQVTLLPIQEMPLLDAAILFSDILFPLAAFHLQVLFDSNSSAPQICSSEPYENSLYGRVQMLCTLKPKAIEEVCSPVYTAIGLVLKELQGLPLIGFCGAPWTLMTYILSGRTSENGQESLSFLEKEPTLFIKLLKLVESLIVDHLAAQIEAGCDAIQLFDSWALSLSQKQFQEYIVPSLDRVSEALSKRIHGRKVPLIYFSKQIEKRLPLLVDSNLTALSCDHESSLLTVSQWAKSNNRAVQGNLDPFLLTKDPTDPELLDAIAQMLAIGRKEPHYICNLGHGIPKNAKYETVRFVVEHIKNQS